MMMSSSNKILSIDIETFSSVDIGKCGAYKYVSSKDFEILLFAYRYNDDEVEVIDMTKEELPESIKKDLLDTKVTKCAFNANFERIALSVYLKQYLPPEGWECTMVKALTLGLPGSLDACGKALGFKDSDRKMKAAGTRLINTFSKPIKPTIKNGGRTRNLPEHEPEKWAEFIEYNRRDVEVEIKIRKLCDKFPMLPEEYKAWCTDQRINDRGVRLDKDLADSVIELSEAYSKSLLGRAKAITGLDNPNSLQQLKLWLSNRLDKTIEGLTKADVSELLENDIDADVRKVLEIRQELGKTSTKKYVTMQNSVCDDDRIHGLLQFYGANRTGRWAGRLVQVQNLPQNKIPDLEYAKDLVKGKDLDGIKLIYGSFFNTISQLIRTAFIPSNDNKFMVADFSAIEARVIAWLAGEQWRIDTFLQGGDIYCASASQMFGVPVVKHGVNGHLRQKGKIAELALGYGGSVGALTSMGALNMGLTEDELPELVSVWRDTNPAITKLWWDIDKAAKKCVKNRTSTKTHGITFKWQSGIMFVKLPSGRELAYCKPHITMNKFDSECIGYWGVDQTTKQWCEIKTYGPKLVENIVQGIARDCLRDAIENVVELGLKPVMHVHDEIIVDAPKSASLDEMVKAMCKVPKWAEGLPLNADGYECSFYMKD